MDIPAPEKCAFGFLSALTNLACLDLGLGRPGVLTPGTAFQPPDLPLSQLKRLRSVKLGFSQGWVHLGLCPACIAWLMS